MIRVQLVQITAAGSALFLAFACPSGAATPDLPTAASPIVAVPAQPAAALEITVGTDGVGRGCRVVRSAGDPSGERLACLYFSRAGHEVRTGKDGRPVEYQRTFDVARSFLRQLGQARP